MPFSAIAKSRMLAVFEGTLLVGLLTAEGEVADPNYRRQPVELMAIEVGILENPAEVRFPAHAEDGPPVVGWFLTDGAGVELVAEVVEFAKPIGRGERPYLEPGAIMVRLRDVADGN